MQKRTKGKTGTRSIQGASAQPNPKIWAKFVKSCGGNVATANTLLSHYAVVTKPLNRIFS